MPFNFTPPQQGAYEGFRDVQNNLTYPEEKARTQSKLDMQMMSKQIELQQQSRIGEAQAKQGMETLPPDEMQALGRLHQRLGQSLNSGASPEFNLSEFRTQPGQAMAAKLLDIYASHAMAGAKTEAYQVPWFSDTTGQRIGYKSFNQFGKPVAQKADPGGAEKEKQGIALLNGLNSLDQLDNAQKNIDFGRISGVLPLASSAMGLDDGNMARFKAYKNLVASMATPLVTGSHRFAPAEQAQLQQMLGSAFSTGAEVKAAADAIRNVYNTGAANLGLGEDPGWQEKHASRLAAMHLSKPLGAGPNPAAAQQAPQGMPGMGGMTQEDFAAEDARRAHMRTAGPRAGGKNR